MPWLLGHDPGRVGVIRSAVGRTDYAALATPRSWGAYEKRRVWTLRTMPMAANSAMVEEPP